MGRKAKRFVLSVSVLTVERVTNIFIGNFWKILKRGSRGLRAHLRIVCPTRPDRAHAYTLHCAANVHHHRCNPTGRRRVQDVYVRGPRYRFARNRSNFGRFLYKYTRVRIYIPIGRLHGGDRSHTHTFLGLPSDRKLGNARAWKSK